MVAFWELNMADFLVWRSGCIRVSEVVSIQQCLHMFTGGNDSELISAEPCIAPTTPVTCSPALAIRTKDGRLTYVRCDSEREQMQLYQAYFHALTTAACKAGTVAPQEENAYSGYALFARNAFDDVLLRLYGLRERQKAINEAESLSRNPAKLMTNYDTSFALFDVQPVEDVETYFAVLRIQAGSPVEYVFHSESVDFD